MVGPVQWLDGALSSGSITAVPLSFALGVTMGLNPCCLALYPAAAATCCAGACEEQPRRAPLSRASMFVLGTATATTALGVVASLAGSMMSGVGGWMRYAIAIVPVLMGAQALGLIRLPFPKTSASRERRGVIGAYVTGLLLSLVMTPCGTPALGAILSYAAYKGNVAYGALLLFAYGLGNGLPLLAVGVTAGGLIARLRSAAWLRWTERAAGGVFIALGAYLLWKI